MTTDQNGNRVSKDIRQDSDGIARVNWWTEDSRDYYSAWLHAGRGGHGHDHNGEVPANVLDTETWLSVQFPGSMIREVN
jgi:hypothetical protein